MFSNLHPNRIPNRDQLKDLGIFSSGMGSVIFADIFKIIMGD